MRQTCLYCECPIPYGSRFMEKHLQCVVEGCEAQFSAENEEEILKQVATHAAHDHGVTEASPELVAKVRSAIRDA